jgi:hypothetical protein
MPEPDATEGSGKSKKTNERIVGPVVIAGLQRTGTTILQRLLAQDTHHFRSIPGWEIQNPAPSADVLSYLLSNNNNNNNNEDEAERKKREEMVTTGRLKEAVTNVAIFYWLAPHFFVIHPTGAELPEEDCMLLDLQFMSQVWESLFSVPAYSSWLERQDQLPAYECLRACLGVLQWQRTCPVPPGEGESANGHRWGWLLKTPNHLEWLDVLLDVFPHAKIIQTHRNPLQTVASFCSMVGHTRGIFSDRVSAQEVGSHWLAKIRRLLHQTMGVRRDLGALPLDYFPPSRLDEIVPCGASSMDSGPLPVSPRLKYVTASPNQSPISSPRESYRSPAASMHYDDSKNCSSVFLDVSYSALMSNPIGQIERIYKWLDIPLTPEVKEKMLQTLKDENRVNKYGVHNYNLEDFGLNNEEVVNQLQFYMDRFNHLF